MTVDATRRLLGNAPWLGDLLASSSHAATSLEAMSDFLGADTALKAREKYLFIAAISAVKGRPDATNEWMARALAAGLSVDAARHAAGLMLLSRGLEVSKLLFSAIQAAGHAPLANEIVTDEHPTRDEINEYFVSVFGQLPDRVTLLGDHVPGALVFYHVLRKSGLEAGALEPRIAELMVVAVNAGEYQRDYIAIHAAGALKKGADERQLVEACVCAIPFTGIAAWFPAAEAILGLRNRA
jgi:alkylhydroperoxidase/carboxymuconolactone decarboxylase family protein YurZ